MSTRAISLLLVRFASWKHSGVTRFCPIYIKPPAVRCKVNLYGSGDNLDFERSYVIAMLILKCDEAKARRDEEAVVGGNGSSTHEFLYVDDAAKGIIKATESFEKSIPVNLGSGYEISIKDLVALIGDVSGFRGHVTWDTTKHNGQPRRKLDTSRAKELFAFEAQTTFENGLRGTMAWYLNK